LRVGSKFVGRSHLIPLNIIMKNIPAEKRREILNRIILMAFRNMKKDEFEKLQEDFRKFDLGAILWAKELYPNATLIMSLIMGPIFKAKFLPEMKAVVDQYFKFLNDVKMSNDELYLKEMEESRGMVFEKMLQPIDLLVEKDPFLKKLNQREKERLNSLAPQYENYLNKINEEFQSFSTLLTRIELPKKEEFDISSQDVVKEVLKEIFKNLKEGDRDPKNIPIPEVFKDKINQMKTIHDDVMDARRKLVENMKNLNKEFFPDLPKVREESKKYFNIIMGVYCTRDTAWVYQKLKLIEDIDSFNIHFTKYIARLSHILAKNDRNYVQKQTFITITKYDSKIRKKLKKFLKELSLKYPNLANYILEMFNLNKYRIIEAHDNPLVRISNGSAYISRFGTQKEVEMDMTEIMKILNTYMFFIRALKLTDKVNN